MSDPGPTRQPWPGDDPSERGWWAAPTSAPAPWRWYVRSHFARPKPGPVALLTGSVALVVSAGPFLLALLHAVGFWTSRADAGLYPQDAMELYDSALITFLVAVLGCLILAVPVLARVLRTWTLMPGLLLTAVCFYDAFSAPPPHLG